MWRTRVIGPRIWSRLARGYRNSETLQATTYLIAGKLDLRLPA
jgi:hypothetical protein